MAGKGEVQILINASDQASAKLKQVGVNADKMAKGFAIAGASMIAVGGAIVGSITKMVNSYSKAGDAVAKMSDRTGIGTEALSEIKYALDLSGSSLDGFEKAVRTMQGAIVDAQAGMATYTVAFERIGVDIEALQGLKPEEQFWMIANAIAAMADDTEQAAAASDIFGSRLGTQLLPMLESGSEAIADMRQEAHDLNLVFSEESAKAAEDFEDAKTRLTGALTGIGNAIAEAVLPQFQEFVDMLTEKLKPAMAWLKEHPEVVDVFLKFGIALGVGGAIFLGVSAFIKLLNMSMIPTIIRAASAFVAMMAAAGPAGWGVLAASAGIAALAISELTNLVFGGVSTAWRTQMEADIAAAEAELRARGIEPPARPEYQYGGIVPGAIGQPVPVIAHGGEMFLGEGNRLGSTINISVGALMGDEASLRKFARMIKSTIGEDNRRNTFGQVSRGYYFGRSSI